MNKNILILSYSILASLYLFASINNTLDGLTGNRTLGAFLALGYFLFMIIGLIKFQLFFAVLSALNFFIGLVILFWIQMIVFPKTHIFYIIVALIGILGLYSSIKLIRVNHKI